MSPLLEAAAAITFKSRWETEPQHLLPAIFPSHQQTIFSGHSAYNSPLPPPSNVLIALS